ncbi:MAG: T9SS type A sorting domain-containing protein, partial [Bacteroidetes bacterium]|nr:T9SS type A sorting domain-containing protein [Bacteroidota bacterium]
NSYVSTSNDYPLAIGRHFTNCCYNTNPPYYSYPFKGKVDDFRLYNRALTPHEAWLLYHGFDTTFSYVPQNGDVVYCVYTSTGTPVVTDTSNYITMTVNALPADIGQSTGLQPSLQSGLVAYYPFNGNANDESGNGINCINYGALLTSDRFGNANSAYIFDGLNDYLGSGSNTLFENADNHALVAWFKSTKKGSPQGIAAYTDNGDAGYTLYMTELDSIGIVNGTGYPNYCVAVANQSFTNDTTWHFLATSRNNGISSLFLDGVLQFETCNHLITFNGCRMFIGQTGFFFGQFFGGKIDNVRFYNRALTAEEIACLYTGNCLTLTADLTADSICVGNNTSLNIQNSQSGIKYQMLKNAVNYGTFQIGNGNTLTFPISGLAQTSTFTIHATNTTTGCNIMLDSTFTVYVGQMVNAIVSPNDTVCSGISTTLTASGGTGYTWSNGMTTAAITVSPLATTVYHVTVTNNSGCADTDSVMVSVNQRPVPTIAGPTAICLGTNNATYTTQTGMSGYTWTVSPGGTITSGSATNTITVTWNTLGAQTVNVNYANSFGCTASAPVSMTVTVNPMVAPTLTGVTNLCVNSGYYFYSTEPGMNNYVWSVSSGATIIWGNGTKELMVSWDVPGTQWISVNYSNSSGCTASTPTQLNITVNPLPSSAGTVSGAETVCAGTSGVSYSTTPIPDAVTYVWSLPQGATIASGAGTASILVNFGSSAQPGDVTVYGNNLCGNGAVSLPLHVNVAALPGNAGVPAGAEVVCQGDSGVIYYVSPIFNAVFYIWDITGGGVITAGNGTNSIQAKFPTGPANCSVTVYGANSCGAGVISPVLNVIVNLLPPAPVITQNGSELVSSAPAGNQWYFNGTLIPGANQPTFIPEHSGIYSVRITLEGCISDMSNEIDYIMTGIGSSEPFSVKVYPVPNNGQFSVYLNSGKKERVTLSVWNGLGEKVFELQGIEFTGNRQQPIDLTPRPAGIYTLVVDGENLWVVRKVVVE